MSTFEQLNLRGTIAKNETVRS